MCVLIQFCFVYGCGSLSGRYLVFVCPAQLTIRRSCSLGSFIFLPPFAGNGSKPARRHPSLSHCPLQVGENRKPRCLCHKIFPLHRSLQDAPLPAYRRVQFFVVVPVFGITAYCCLPLIFLSKLVFLPPLQFCRIWCFFQRKRVPVDFGVLAGPEIFLWTHMDLQFLFPL